MPRHTFFKHFCQFVCRAKNQFTKISWIHRLSQLREGNCANGPSLFERLCGYVNNIIRQTFCMVLIGVKFSHIDGQASVFGKNVLKTMVRSCRGNFTRFSPTLGFYVF